MIFALAFFLATVNAQGPCNNSTCSSTCPSGTMLFYNYTNTMNCYRCNCVSNSMWNNGTTSWNSTNTQWWNSTTYTSPWNNNTTSWNSTTAPWWNSTTYTSPWNNGTTSWNSTTYTYWNNSTYWNSTTYTWWNDTTWWNSTTYNPWNWNTTWWNSTTYVTFDPWNWNTTWWNSTFTAPWTYDSNSTWNGNTTWIWNGNSTYPTWTNSSWTNGGNSSWTNSGNSSWSGNGTQPWGNSTWSGNGTQPWSNSGNGTTCPYLPCFKNLCQTPNSTLFFPKDNAGCDTCPICIGADGTPEQQGGSNCPTPPQCPAGAFFMKCAEGSVLGVSRDANGCITSCPACFNAFTPPTTVPLATPSNTVVCGPCNDQNKPVCEGNTIATKLSNGNDGCCTWRCAANDFSSATSTAVSLAVLVVVALARL